MKPGELFLAQEPIIINANRPTIHMKVRNTGDRPVQVGSHFHFFEVNRALDFDRPQALGMHLNIPAGAAIRFEPGDEKEVTLVEFGGSKRIVGFNGLINGGLISQWTAKMAMERARNLGFQGIGKIPQDMAEVFQRRATEDQGKKGHRK